MARMAPTAPTIENFDQDIDRLEELADELEAYILGDETYRTLMLPRTRGYERTTMSGGQLLSLMNYLLRARAELTAEQQTRLDGITVKVEQTIGELRTPFQQHLAREAHSHLDRLQWFLDSCQDDAEQCKRDFPNEIQNRQRLEEMRQVFGENLPDDIAAAMAQVDQRIRAMSEDGDFVWPQRSKAFYPTQPYWYLYITPAVDRNQRPG